MFLPHPSIQYTKRVLLKIKPLLILPLLCCFIISCEDASSLRDNALIYCIESQPSQFNPQRMTSDADLEATSRHLYNRLLEVDAMQRLQPSLATDWSASADNTRYRFSIRKGVAFHHTSYFTPTRNLNADDVIFSFGRVTEGLHPFHLMSGGSYPFFQGTEFSRLVKEIVKIDQYTVEFVLQHPSPNFLAYLAADYAVIHSKEYGNYLERQGLRALIDFEPIGTGPYKFFSQVAHHSIHYVKHPQYWASEVPIEHLYLDITPQTTARLAKLMTNECDVMAAPAATQMQIIHQHPELAIVSQSRQNIAYLAFNTRHPDLARSAVRKAIATAINREQLIDTVYYGYGDVADTISPNHTPASSFMPMKSRLLAPLKAKARLLELGADKLSSLVLYVDKDPQPYNPNPVKMARIIKQSLAEIGVDVNIEAYDRSILEQKLPLLEYDLFLTGWESDTIDPDPFYRQQFSCNARFGYYNYSQFCDKKFDKLLNEGAQLLAEKEKKQTYQQLQNYLLDQLPILPLAYTHKMYAIRNTLTGIKTSPYGGISFSATSRKP